MITHPRKAQRRLFASFALMVIALLVLLVVRMLG